VQTYAGALLRSQINVAILKFASYFGPTPTLKEANREAEKRTTRAFRGTGYIG
jgi:hypothetical protein